jgi:DNA-binding MarR family transcriptional regulator
MQSEPGDTATARKGGKRVARRSVQGMSAQLIIEVQPLAVKGEDYSDRMRSLGHLSRIAFRDFSAALGSRLAKHGVTSGQWRFLRVLWEEDNISQRQLADRVGTREATAVRSIRSLMKSGLVVRREDPHDARKFRIVLTTKARKLERKLLPYVTEVHAIAARGIAKADLETTRHVLLSMHHNLRAVGTSAPFDEDRFA